MNNFHCFSLVDFHVFVVLSGGSTTHIQQISGKLGGINLRDSGYVTAWRGHKLFILTPKNL